MWIKKWYLKRNISCDAHLLIELLETDVPWVDAIMVSTGKLRKLWDSVSELCRSLCERWLERSVLRLALLPVKTAQFTQFFCQVWHTVKSLSVLRVYWVPYGSSLVEPDVSECPKQPPSYHSYCYSSVWLYCFSHTISVQMGRGRLQNVMSCMWINMVLLLLVWVHLVVLFFNITGLNLLYITCKSIMNGFALCVLHAKFCIKL